MNVVRVIIPDAGPINTLAAARLLSLLIAPAQIRLTLIQSVVDEILAQSAELSKFMAAHASRIDVIETSVCADNRARRARGEILGKGRGDLAIADFLLNYIDDVTKNAPALLITEDKRLLGRLSKQEAFTPNTHFITTAAYLRALENRGVIASFSDIWRSIVDANANDNPVLHRSPNPAEINIQSDPESALFEDEDSPHPS